MFSCKLSNVENKQDNNKIKGGQGPKESQPGSLEILLVFSNPVKPQDTSAGTLVPADN